MSDALEAAAIALATCDALEYEDAARAVILAFLDAVDTEGLAAQAFPCHPPVVAQNRVEAILAAVRAKASADAGSHTSQK